MRILAVNAGSSSLKLRILDADDTVAGTFELDAWDGEIHDEMADLARQGSPIDAVGHRVVHGGTELTAAVRLDDAAVARIEALTELAPLHQPRALAGIRALRRLLPEVPAVACFDTAFHATLPPEASTYALPREWRARWPIRRFGFHGLSHAYAARRAAAITGIDAPRVVSCHLGAGASLCASRSGRSVDTTMGFTPLEGLVMQTRAGSIDPGLVLWLAERMPMTDLADGLQHRSGVAALAGTDGDFQALLAARAEGDGAATLAFDVFVHRLQAEIGAMSAVLGGLDVLVFTGGIGEHAAPVREAAATTLGHLGVVVDAAANRAARGDAEIGVPGAGARTLVVQSREDLEIARQVRALLDPSRDVA